MPDITNSIMPDAGSEYFDYKGFAPRAIPRGISTGGWTVQSQGFQQQTFLGASITSFNMNGGFGDTSSTLSVNLVVDEFNRSDETDIGNGADVYHSGKRDTFNPPFIGSPVFFTFGHNRRSVKQTFHDIIDEEINSGEPPCSSGVIPDDDQEAGTHPFEVTALASGENSKFLDLDPDTKGYYKHEYDDEGNVKNSCALGFGGVLQSYVQSRSANGNPTYSVQVTDPREILSNVKLLLNNYTGSVHDNDNVFNIYGFLEYDVPSSNASDTDGENNPAFEPDNYDKNLIKRKVLNDGTVEFIGDDTYDTGNDPTSAGAGIARYFPITGIGMSRRSTQGIPFYRVDQALKAMMSIEGDLPKVYKDAKFSNLINFRGFKYIVDLSGLPKLPDFYYLDYDEMSLLELALEICDVMNRDLFVKLWPVVDHEYSTFLYERNKKAIQEALGVANGKEDDDKGKFTNVDDTKTPFIAGIIRVEAIDRSKQQDMGSIKEFLDTLEEDVENRDVGFELSNITTDKFIVGAQETDMHFFHTMHDRLIQPYEDLDVQYDLKNMLEQQVIPYYGTLGSNNVVTIPKGYGSYQQILLDTRSLNANGVGTYYVATEMEMRAALVSYKNWKQFLLRYNNTYMESTEENDIEEATVLSVTARGGVPKPFKSAPVISENYEVTVPRSLWPCFASGIDAEAEDVYGDDDLPLSPCNPPYGYPLYYKRATKLGIPEAGLTNITYTWNSQIMPALTKIQQESKNINSENFKTQLNGILDQIHELLNQAVDKGDLSDRANEEDAGMDFLKEIQEYIEECLDKDEDEALEVDFDFIFDKVSNIQKGFSTLPRLQKKGTENAQRVHSFIKNIASECLGKKYLVKLPMTPNLGYSKDMVLTDASSEFPVGVDGPHGFKPLPANSGMADKQEEYNEDFMEELAKDAKNSRNFKTQDIDSGETSDGVATSKDYLTFGDTLLERVKDEPFDKYKGAFRLGYNPVANTIVTNYRPEPQGGFFKRDLYKDLYDEEFGVNVALDDDKKLPRGVKQKLIPNILSKFTNGNGRISAYVRYDSSEFLSFDGMNRDDFVQNKVVNDKYVPDLSYNLDNLSDSNTDFTRFYNKNKEDGDEAMKPLDKQVAFVKCSVSDNIYFSPAIIKRDVQVHARDVKDRKLVTPPRKIVDPKTGKQVLTFGFCLRDYYPDPETRQSATSTIYDFVRHDEKDQDGEVVFHAIVDTKEELIVKSGLEPDSEQLFSAYALITVPGRVAPTKDALFRDGPYQFKEVHTLKHYMTMDVVKDVENFDKPEIGDGTVPDILGRLLKREDCVDDKSQRAEEAYKAALDKLQYSSPESILNLAMPSPVMPDLVALPLTSTERCYGPWISSEVDDRNDTEKFKELDELPRYRDLGGSVEFIKDENLAPWNYFGYTSLNEAGKLQAIFSNSLLLQSERGGFVVPGLPSGMSLAKQLRDRGPLITNISVDVSPQGIRTTTQLDLYTVSFGKLQVQKEQELARSSRNRKKLSDERNALLRKGIGKNQTDVNYLKMQKEFEDKISVFQSMVNTDINSKLIPPTDIVATVKTETMDRYTPNADGEVGESVKGKRVGVDVAMQSKDALEKAGEDFSSFAAANKSYYNSAGGDLGSMYTPASMEPFHPNMPFVHHSNIDSKDFLFFEDTGDTNGDNFLDITVYED